MTTVLTIGGAMALEGVALLAAAGVKLVETDPYPARDDLLAAIRLHQPEAFVVRLIDRVDAEIIAASPRLRLIAKHGVGTNDIDLAAAKSLGVPVIMATGANAHSVAEHALGFILALSKDFARQDGFIRQGRWDKGLYRGRELRGQRLGLVGLGLIGRTLAEMVRPIGLSVSAYDPFAPDSAFAGLTRATDLDQLLADSDIVSLHCPLTAETRGLIDDRRIGLMKPGALLINTARGELVDEAALITALQSGQIGAAGLDSFAEEPPKESALWTLSNVILTPHVAGVTDDAKRRVSLMSAENVLRFLRGEDLPPNVFARA